MSQSSELLVLAASVLYTSAAIMALRAAAIARADTDAPHWHRRVWLIAAVLFVACAASRLLGLEEGLRALLRGELRDGRLYDGRREYQAAIASAIIILASFAAFIAMAKVMRSGVLASGRRSHMALASGLACTVMVMLIVVRIVSLHMLDVLLYRGPRLNWIIDIGTTVMVGVLAWLYAAKPRRQQRQ